MMELTQQSLCIICIFVYLNVSNATKNTTGTSQMNRLEWIKIWDDYWHYKVGEIDGPQLWGNNMLKPKNYESWKSCRKGRYQSPINIPLNKLIYDSSLEPLQIQGYSKSIHLMIENMGQDIIFNHISDEVIIFEKGPLVYSYRFFSFLIKFGSSSSKGSDHQINNQSFAGEIQLYAYNQDLYSNLSEALNKPNGMVAISALFQIKHDSSDDLTALINGAAKCNTEGAQHDLEGIKLQGFLPSMDQYITYPGSLPFPPCVESVTWIVLNEQIYITDAQLKTLRTLRLYKTRNSGRMYDNFRPRQKFNDRFIRTNVFFNKKQFCDVERKFSYKMNSN